MQRLQAFRYELMPNGQQERQMRRFTGSCWLVYNKALALQKANYEAGGKFIGYVAMAKYLTEWRNGLETPWLKQAPVHPLQHALKDLDRAYQNFFDQRAAFPQFKKKGGKESFRYPDAKQFKLDESNGRIFLPKLCWMRLRLSRPLLGTPKNATVSHRAGKWYVSIQTEREVETPVPPATNAIGIDVGIAHCRKDFLHKATTAISQNHALVCIEDLQLCNMSKSARGSQEQPGKNVRAKSGLNRSILDQGWSQFRRQLEYKLQCSGGMLVAVPPQNTSRTCPCCGHVSKDNRRTQMQFLCVACGYQNHADVVGAMNVLERGLRLLACAEDISRARVARPKRAASVKQEPTEATSTSAMLVTGAVGIPCL